MSSRDGVNARDGIWIRGVSWRRHELAGRHERRCAATPPPGDARVVETAATIDMEMVPHCGAARMRAGVWRRLVANKTTANKNQLTGMNSRGGADARRRLATPWRRLRRPTPPTHARTHARTHAICAYYIRMYVYAYAHVIYAYRTRDMRVYISLLRGLRGLCALSIHARCTHDMRAGV